jgi:hypothetical protein
VVPELASLIGDDLCRSFSEKKDKESLRAVFNQLMESSNDLITSKLDQLLKRLNTLSMYTFA